MSQIEIVGLNATDITAGNQMYAQYSLILKQGKYHQVYTFSPKNDDTYSMNCSVAIDVTVQTKPFQPITVEWIDGGLYAKTDETLHKLFDCNTGELDIPIHWFQSDATHIQLRPVLIISRNADAILPMICKDKTIMYVDEWTTLPPKIPEDVIVISTKKYPINDIVMRLPARSKAIFISPDILT
jgi:hypothetical protein